MKKAFTLVELIATIIIIGIIALLAIPPILKSINSTKIELSDTMKAIIISAGKLYASDNNLPKYNGYHYCITLQKLVEEEYLNSNLKDPVTKKDIPLNKFVKIQVFNNNYEYDITDSCS